MSTFPSAERRNRPRLTVLSISCMSSREWLFFSGVGQIHEVLMKSLGIKKLYYSISEVSKITELEQYVLRYWESEFDQLKPAKNRAGNRIYTNRDIKLILHIKKLLRDERYTIEGAKQVLKAYTPDLDSGEQLELIDAPKPRAKIKDEQLRADVTDVKKFLEEL